MKITDYQNGKIIYLESSFDNRAKFLNIIYFLCFTSVGIFFIYMPLQGNSLTIGLFTFIFIASGIYLFGAYRFINKALKSEKLILNTETLTIYRGGLFSSKKVLYEISKISNFRHLDKPQLTKHPLAGNNFDYLGFQTEQQVINEVHGDNRIAFDYNNNTIEFGENIYSWDFEELEVTFNQITGRGFRKVENIEDIET
jgi:hypothetical protein